MISPAGFRRFWLAQAISQFGDRVTELALPLIAVGLLAAGPNQVGLLNAAVWLPYLASFLVGSSSSPPPPRPCSSAWFRRTCFSGPTAS